MPQGDSNDDEARREQKLVASNQLLRSRGKGLQIQIQDSKRQGPVELANKSDWKDPLSRLSEKKLRRQGKTLIVDRYNIKITREKIECLFGTSWLNSEVIAFWLEWWREQIGAGSEGNMPAQNSTSKCYFSSTYFYSKMMEGGYNYKAIKRWTKKIDIFALDMIILPINETNSHWFLAVIDFIQQRIEIYDSLGKAHSAVRETLLRWLGDEHMSRKSLRWTKLIGADSRIIGLGSRVSSTALIAGCSCACSPPTLLYVVPLHSVRKTFQRFAGG